MKFFNNKKKIKKDSDNFWNGKLTFKVRMLHFLTTQKWFKEFDIIKILAWNLSISIRLC